MGDEKEPKFIFKKIKTILVSIAIIAPIAVIGLVVASYYIVGNNHQYVLDEPAELKNTFGEAQTIAIVFGSGITPEKEPRPILQQRLDAALDLYNSGYLEHIIVSGYHPYERYNEPAAMANYLIENGVLEPHITQDTYGNNTFTTCDRAKNEFGVTKAIVITQPSHIDRAIYLCRAKQIETYGYPAKITGSEDSRRLQSFREALSNVKAVYDTTIYRIKN